MIMPSFSSYSIHNQQPSPRAKQRTLQLQHKELEQCLRDKLQSLKLQINVHRSQTNSVINDPTIVIIQQLLLKQAQIQQIFSQQLLRKQIHIQEEKQMKEIINNYQKRIWDLRSILINKQAEISAASFQFSRDSVTKKQNVQLVNNYTIQKSTIAKYNKQRKKILVEIQALQYTLKSLQTNKLKSNDKKHKKQNVNFQSFQKKQSQQRGEEQKSQKSFFASNNYQKDLLLEKVLNLLQVEMNKHETQRKLCQQLKNQLQFCQQKMQNLIKDYKNIEQQKNKLHIKTNQHPQNKETENKLCFMKELQQQLRKTNSTGLSIELFTNIDINQEQNRLRSTTPKGRTNMLRQRKRRTCKQN